MVSAISLCLLALGLTAASSQLLSSDPELVDAPISERRTFKHGKPVKVIPFPKKHKKFAALAVPHIFGKGHYEGPIVHDVSRPIYKVHRYHGIEVKPAHDASFSTPEPFVESHSIEPTSGDFSPSFTSDNSFSSSFSDHSFSSSSFSDHGPYVYEKPSFPSPPPAPVFAPLPPSPPKPIFSFVPAPQPVFQSIPIAPPAFSSVSIPRPAPIPALPAPAPVFTSIPSNPLPPVQPVVSVIPIKIQTPVLPAPSPAPIFQSVPIKIHHPAPALPALPSPTPAPALPSPTPALALPALPALPAPSPTPIVVKIPSPVLPAAPAPILPAAPAPILPAAPAPILPAAPTPILPAAPAPILPAAPAPILPAVPAPSPAPVLPSFPVAATPAPILPSIPVSLPSPQFHIPAPAPSLPTFPALPAVPSLPISSAPEPEFPYPPSGTPIPSYIKDISLSDVDIKGTTVEPPKFDEPAPAIDDGSKNFDHGFFQKIKGWKADKANAALNHFTQFVQKPIIQPALSIAQAPNKVPVEIHANPAVQFPGPVNPLPLAPASIFPVFPPAQFFPPAKYESFPPNNIETPPLLNSYGLPIPHDSYAPPHISHERLSSAASEEEPAVVPAPENKEQNLQLQQQQDFGSQKFQPQAIHHEHPVYVAESNKTDNKTIDDAQPETNESKDANAEDVDSVAHNYPNHKE